MKLILVAVFAFVGVFSTLSTAVPLSELREYDELYEVEDPYQEIVRERRSPQQQPPPPPPPPSNNRGSVSVTGGHTSGQGGFARGEYNHRLWQNSQGARLDANTYYQRNWGSPGPRQDYGGGLRLTVPLGGRRN